jgi:hypothetical protein
MSSRVASAYQSKLVVLAREAFDAAGAPGGFPGGASLLADDGRGFVLVEGDGDADAGGPSPSPSPSSSPSASAGLGPGRALGGAMAWARSVGATGLHVLVADAGVAGVLARRALQFADPPSVHVVTGRAVEPAAPTSPPTLVNAVPAAAAQYVQAFIELGAEPVVEDGVLRAEVLGLEVGRVDPDGLLEVGVGKHDREAQVLMHPDRQPLEALAAAVDAVKQHRRPGAPTHPMNQLAASRWLRAVVCADPAMVGAAELHAIPSLIAQPDLRLPTPAPAAGPGVVVMCSTGIDIDLVPAAADARAAHDPGARLVLVVPEVDAHPVTRDLAAALKEPAEVVTVPADWRAARPQ